MAVQFHNDWQELLLPEFQKEYYLRLREFLKQEYRTRTIYPDMYDIFNAMHFTRIMRSRSSYWDRIPIMDPDRRTGLAFQLSPALRCRRH